MKKPKATAPTPHQYCVLRQICNYIPVFLVARLARATGVDQKARTFSPWSHMVALLYAQLTHAIGLNDVCDALRLHSGPLSALRGATAPTRNNLSHANKHRDACLAQQLFWSVLEHLKALHPRFAGSKKGKRLLYRFKRTIHAVDSTTIQLVASCMDWAKHRRRKAAAKCHLRLDLQSFSAFLCHHRHRQAPQQQARPRSLRRVASRWNGAEPIVPAIPGLRELEGIWTNRQITGMKAIPRRLLVLGGGPAGVEMAQAVRRLGGEAVIVERSSRLLSREAAPLGEALADLLRREGIGLYLGVPTTAARRAGDEYVLELGDGRELRGDHLLVATGRRPRVENVGLETVGIAANEHGIPVDTHLRVGDRLWAIGDVTGIWKLTHVGKYQGEIAASNILGEPREANYEAVPRVVFTDPQAAAVGATEARFSATAALKEVAKTATYTLAYAESNGFLTLLSDGDRLTGAYALGPEAGEWLQQATLAIRTRVPLAVLRDTIQPFPTFSEIFVDALRALHVEMRKAARSPSASGTKP